MLFRSVNSGEEYLIPDAVTQDFGVFGTTNYEWGTNVIQAGLRFDTRNITSEAHGIQLHGGSFAALKKEEHLYELNFHQKPLHDLQ